MYIYMCKHAYITYIHIYIYTYGHRPFERPPFHISMALSNSMSTTSKYRNAQKHCNVQYEITYF